MTALFHASAPGPIDEDAQQPGLERGPTFEAVNATHDSEPRVLHDFLGDRLRRNEGGRDAQHGVVMAGDEHDESLFVSRAQAFEQLDIVLHSRDATTPVAPRCHREIGGTATRRWSV